MIWLENENELGASHDNSNYMVLIAVSLISGYQINQLTGTFPQILQIKWDLMVFYSVSNFKKWVYEYIFLWT